MCGIVGLVQSDPKKQVSLSLLKRMCDVIQHRGPDDSGTWTQGHVGMGMTRLSIIDIAGGQQPIHNEDKTVWIVFNGEIYNYRELRQELLEKGHRFYTSSDTETIVHLYEEYGDNCVDYLRGMFAFSIWDQRKEMLFLARDRLGKKPLHYYLDGKGLIWGSEIKSILQCPDVSREVYPPALVNYLAYGYVPDPDTMFKGIYKLPPGSILTYKNGKVDVRPYWDVEYKVEKIQSEEFYIERLLEILSESVKLRLVSEVPLGAFLSGGIDSSMVVALMARHMTEPVKTFSIGFEDQSYDELHYARTVAKEFGTDHHEEIVKPDAESIIQDLVRQFDEPFADSSAIPSYYVSKMAKQWVTVALSGDGGDELFGGYPRYLNGAAARWTNWIPKSIKKGIFQNIAGLLPEWSPGINTLRNISCDENERYIRHMSKGISTVHKDVFSREFIDKVDNTDPSPALMRYLDAVKEKDRVTRRMYQDTKTYLPGDLLTKVDRTSMMVSLEVRAPILDHHLVEFAATIPSYLKINGNSTKYIFKKAAERLLPKEVIYRSKQGFAVPVKTWIRREWTEMSYDLVLGERALTRCNFNPRFLRNTMSEHRWGRRDHSYIIWTLMILELWFRQFIDTK
jgi:asparagine synthase (glutamine-hydrolysing)